jgi:hypothetical protein
VILAAQLSVCNDGGAVKVKTFKKTCLACPSQWEGHLDDGRVVYVRYRHGELSVGVGKTINAAVQNAGSEEALYAEELSDCLDGFMTFEELKGRLWGVLKFPTGLVVENER